VEEDLEKVRLALEQTHQLLRDLEGRVEALAKNRPPEMGPDALSLFNGKDLTGWSGQFDRVRVKDGLLVSWKEGEVEGGWTEITLTEKSFTKDYHFQMEYRCSGKARCGVWLERPEGRKTEIDIRETRRTGWKTLDVVRTNDRVTHWIDGQKQEEITPSGWSTSTSRIGFAVTLGTFEFRKLRIQESR
jgi:hypothetical protein